MKCYGDILSEYMDKKEVQEFMENSFPTQDVAWQVAVDAHALWCRQFDQDQVTSFRDAVVVGHSIMTMVEADEEGDDEE